MIYGVLLNQFMQLFHQNGTGNDLDRIADEERYDAHHQRSCKTCGSDVHKPQRAKRITDGQSRDHADYIFIKSMPQLLDQKSDEPGSGNIADDISAGRAGDASEASGESRENRQSNCTEKDIYQLA